MKFLIFRVYVTYFRSLRYLIAVHPSTELFIMQGRLLRYIVHPSIYLSIFLSMSPSINRAFHHARKIAKVYCTSIYLYISLIYPSIYLYSICKYNVGLLIARYISIMKERLLRYESIYQQSFLSC